MDVPVTPGPAASTVPAASKPSTVLGGSGMASLRYPARRARSVGLMPAALTLILICPWPGSRSGASAHVSTSGGPYPVITTALGMAVPFCRNSLGVAADFSVFVVRCFLLYRSRLAAARALPGPARGPGQRSLLAELMPAPARLSRVSDPAAAAAPRPGPGRRCGTPGAPA